MKNAIKSEKLQGLESLQQNGLPILPYIELDANVNVEQQILRFMSDYNIERFMVRTAGMVRKFHGTPSINNATIKDNLDEIKGFLQTGFTVMIGHPGNIYRNLHSLNILDEGHEIILEIVGPGFMAPDLTRLGFVHEEIVLDKQLKIVNHRTMTTQEKYKDEVDGKLEQQGRNAAQSNGSYLLSHSKYLPLSEDELGYVISVIPKLKKVAKAIGFDRGITSLSFVDLGKGENEPIFWDIYGVEK